MFAFGQPPSGQPPWTSARGVAAIAPGTSATMDLDLTAGNYAFVCFVPDSATGKAHVELGMNAGLTVQ